MSLAIVRSLQCRSRLVGQAVTLSKFYSTSDSANKNEKNDNKVKDTENKVVKLEKYTRKYVRQNYVEGYFIPRFFDYVSNYDKILAKEFPQAMQVYRTFMDGVKDFFRDMKNYLKCSKIVNNTPKGLSALTRKEIELYYQMPKDMMRVAPVLLISALPFANYVIFPLAFYFPRILLTSHFWSIEQKINFQQLSIKERIIHNRKIFRYLQAKRDQIKEKPKYLELKQVLAHLGSGTHPTPQEIIDVKEIFGRLPYHLNFLTSSHLKALCHLHGIHTHWLKRVRLSERAYILQQMDSAIKREGGVHNMPTEALKKACHIRGVNTQNLSNQEMIDWLRGWVQVSLALSSQHYSLLIHLPVLLTYNFPNNWALIYENKK